MDEMLIHFSLVFDRWMTTPPPRGPPKVAVTKTGRINYTTLEDVPEGKQVLASMFSLNGRPIVVLFYSGATHNFISMACTKSH
jgi:hypothetical protein